jgi:phosphate transport system substrate-binding protein
VNLRLRRKRLAVLSVPLALLLLASACGDDDDDTSSAATTGAPAATSATTTASGSGSATTAASGSATTAASGGSTDSTVKVDNTVSATLNGSGSTFQQAFDQEAIAGFQETFKDVEINYAGGGSGKGKQDLADQLVDFAGSDSLIADADKPKYKGGDFLYFPTVAGPITVSYNLDGVDTLKLSGPTLAKIFSATITKWDDPAIAAENSGAKLPSKDITVVHRADGSGTTQNFTSFLQKSAGADWTLGSGSTVQWPANTQAGNGNAGVAQAIDGTDGAIGYVDYSDAKAAGLSFAEIKNADGQYVKATLEGASAALDGATLNANLTYDPIFAKGATTYPITSPTYIIVYAKQSDKNKGTAVLGFLQYVLTDGQDLAEGVDYAKLPDSMRTQALAQLSKIEVPAA